MDPQIIKIPNLSNIVNSVTTVKWIVISANNINLILMSEPYNNHPTKSKLDANKSDISCFSYKL